MGINCCFLSRTEWLKVTPISNYQCLVSGPFPASLLLLPSASPDRTRDIVLNRLSLPHLYTQKGETNFFLGIYVGILKVSKFMWETLTTARGKGDYIRVSSTEYPPHFGDYNLCDMSDAHHNAKYL